MGNLGELGAWSIVSRQYLGIVCTCTEYFYHMYGNKGQHYTTPIYSTQIRIGKDDIKLASTRYVLNPPPPSPSLGGLHHIYSLAVHTPGYPVLYCTYIHTYMLNDYY